MIAITFIYSNDHSGAGIKRNKIFFGSFKTHKQLHWDDRSFEDLDCQGA
jgi:hypothetical protein